MAQQNSSDDLTHFSLEELLMLTVVTAASGFEQPISHAPAAVTVIHRDEWRNMGARSLTDVLNVVPGVTMTPTTGIATNTAQIRGISGNFGQQVLILIDGKPLKYIQNSGRFPGQRIPLDAFDRIEVIRSPGSAVYGADAVGGIINLVSSDYKHNTLNASAGSHDTHDLSWRHHIQSGDFTWQWALQYQDSADDPDKPIQRDLQSSFDDVFGSNASHAPSNFNQQYRLADLYTKASWHQLSLSAHIHKSEDVGTGVGVAQTLDPGGYIQYQFEQYGLGYSLIDAEAHSLELSLDYNYQRSRTFLHVFPAGTVLPIGDDGNVNFDDPAGIVTFTDGFIGTPSNKSTSSSAATTYIYDHDKHTFRAEIGYEIQRFSARERKNFGPDVIDGTEGVVDGTLTNVTGTPYIYLPNAKREVTHLSLQDHWQFAPAWKTTLGVRFDQYSDFGSTTNPRIGIRWQLNEKVALRSFAGTAFRAPSFVDLYAQNNPAATGNKDLGPEKAKTLEAGFAMDLSLNKNLLINTQLYRYEIRDIIEFVRQPVIGTTIATNVGEQQGWGTEMEATWKISNAIELKGHVSYSSIKDEQDSATPDIPSRMTYAQAIWNIHHEWRLFLGNKWTGERKRAIGDDRAALKSYHWTNGRISYRTQRYELALFVENMFDSDGYLPSNGSVPNDFPLDGRQFRLEASTEF